MFLGDPQVFQPLVIHPLQACKARQQTYPQTYPTSALLNPPWVEPRTPQPQTAACKDRARPSRAARVGARPTLEQGRHSTSPRLSLARIVRGPRGPRALGPGPHSSKECTDLGGEQAL